MARKKRVSKGGATPGNDAASLASSTTHASWGAERGAGGEEESDEFADPFERCTEALYEKRTSTRVAALSELVALLQSSYCYEDCLFRQESLAQMLLASLRKGAAAEAGLAVRALGLHLLTLGLSESVQRLLPEVSLALQTTATAKGKDPGLRAAALEALALLTFAAEEDGLVTDCIMEGLLKIAGSEGKPQIVAAALRGWALLLTSLPSSRLDGAFCSGALAALSPQLLPEDVAVRNAAGEAIAVLFAAAGLASLDPAEEQADDSGEDSDGDGSGTPGGLAEVVARMRDLATHRGDERRRSKRDRQSLKTAFRDHCKAVEGEAMAFERLKLRGSQLLVIDSLEGQVQLNAFRAFLGTALQPQLEANELLRDVFSLGPAASESPDAGCRHSRAPDSAERKRRSLARGRQRGHKADRAGGLLGSPDEGF